MLRNRAQPGQVLVKYECVVACKRPQTNTVTSGHSRPGTQVK